MLWRSRHFDQELVWVCQVEPLRANVEAGSFQRSTYRIDCAHRGVTGEAKQMVPSKFRRIARA
jgi:hypothetical protein